MFPQFQLSNHNLKHFFKLIFQLLNFPFHHPLFPSNYLLIQTWNWSNMLIPLLLLQKTYLKRLFNNFGNKNRLVITTLTLWLKITLQFYSSFQLVTFIMIHVWKHKSKDRRINVCPTSWRASIANACHLKSLVTATSSLISLTCNRK